MITFSKAMPWETARGAKTSSGRKAARPVGDHFHDVISATTMWDDAWFFLSKNLDNGTKNAPGWERYGTGGFQNSSYDSDG
jgi:hypothetical protein